MRISFTGLCLFALFFNVSVAHVAASEPTANQTNAYFEHVKQRVFSDPYPFLPQYNVSRKHFDNNGENLLLKNAKRTLNDNSDFITLDTPHKLLQANGICFAGSWHINNNSEYTGLFEKNTHLPVIVRASVSLSGTKQDDKRAFGIAVKVFVNNLNPVEKQYSETQSLPPSLNTQNIFLMHSLGGTVAPQLLPLPLTNEPALGSLPPFSQLLTAYRLESDLKEADKLVSGSRANSRFRPVSHLAQVHATSVNTQRLLPTHKVIAPYWLRATVASDIPHVDQNDFRDELSLEHYPNNAFHWNIDAAVYSEKGIEHASWQRIGAIHVKESVTSLTCDTKLHFAHPPITSQDSISTP